MDYCFILININEKYFTSFILLVSLFCVVKSFNSKLFLKFFNLNQLHSTQADTAFKIDFLIIELVFYGYFLITSLMFYPKLKYPNAPFYISLNLKDLYLQLNYSNFNFDQNLNSVY